jgi:hypothetical protein
MRAFFRLAVPCILCLSLGTASLAQTLPKPKEQITREQLAEALQVVASATEKSADPEVRSAARVVHILLGSLMTGQTHPMLEYLQPFAIEELQRIDRMRSQQRFQ